MVRETLNNASRFRKDGLRFTDRFLTLFFEWALNARSKQKQRIQSKKSDFDVHAIGKNTHHDDHTHPAICTELRNSNSRSLPISFTLTPHCNGVHCRTSPGMERRQSVRCKQPLSVSYMLSLVEHMRTPVLSRLDVHRRLEEP